MGKLTGFTLGAAGVCGTFYGINTLLDIKATNHHFCDVKPGQYYSWKYGDVFYTNEGTGRPLLLIHDLHPDASVFEWSKVVPELSKERTVYAIDLLGCGRSDKPNFSYTNYFYVQLVNAFIKDVIKEQVDIVVTGHSTPIAIMAKKFAPDMIDKIIAINPVSLKMQKLLPTKRHKALETILGSPFIGTFTYNYVNRREYFKYLFANKYFYNKNFVTDSLIDTYYEESHLKGSKGRFLLASILGRKINIDISKTIKETENLFIIASREKAQSSLIVGGYTNLNPGIEVSYLSKAKLLPQLERPLKVVERIKRFL